MPTHSGVRTREDDRQRDLVRGLLAIGAFDEGDHAVHEAASGLDGDADLAIRRCHRRIAHPGRSGGLAAWLELEVQEREEALAMFCAESGQAGQCRIFAFTVPDLRRSRATDR